MVTYGIAGLFAVFGLAAVVGGVQAGQTAGVVVGLFWIACSIAIAVGERKHRAWKVKFDAECAERDQAHAELMSKLEAQTRELREQAAKWAAEHYSMTVVIKRSDVQPMTEEKAAKVRQEFMIAADVAIANLY